MSAVLASGLAFGQGASVLTGIVTDAATGKPVPDVVVTATSPALQGEEITVTDASGLYRIPQLPPGIYAIRLEKESFKPYSRGDISLRVDRTIRLNVQVQPESLKAEEVVVVGRAPTIDVGSTTTGINVGQDFMRNVALIRPGGVSGTRSFESLAEAAPQVNSDLYGFSVSGTTSPENQFVIDGLSVNDPAYGVNATPLSVEFVQDVNIITGGYMPEYGRATGGVMNVVTKSGSNEFHGSVFFNLTPGALTGPRPEVKEAGSTFKQTQARIWNLGDFGVELGGPILKDKLWFYAGFAPSFARYFRAGSLRSYRVNAADDNSDGDDDWYERDPETGEPILDDVQNSAQRRFADARSYQFIGKLTYALTPDHSLTLSVIGSPFTSGGGAGLGIDPQDGSVDPLFSGTHESTSHIFRSDAYDVALKYAGAAMDKHLLFDVTLGWHHQNTARLAVDGTPIGSDTGAAATPMVLFRRTNPHGILDFEDFGPDVAQACAPVDVVDNSDPANPTTRVVQRCPVNTYTSGGADFMNNSLLDRYQARAMLTYLAQALGHHVIKAGFDLELTSYQNQKAYSGGYRLRESTSGGSFLDHRQFGYLTGPDEFVQQSEQTATSRSTTVGAFLQDSWSIMDVVTLNAGLRWDQQTVFGNDGKVGLALNNQLSPRVGLIYDFTQQGRSKLYGNYARFYESMPLDLTDRAFPGDRQGGFIRSRTATADRQGCDPLTDIGQSLRECKDPGNYVQLGSAWDPSQYAYMTGADQVPVDPALIPQSSDELVFGGEYEVIPDGRAGIQYTRRWMNAVIEDMSRDEANTYFIGNPGQGLAKDFPLATRDYDAVTVYFSKAFSDLWLAQVSYTWSYLRGNYAGLFRPETGQLDPNLNADFDLQSLLPNRTGPLPADRTHVIKVFAAKEFELTKAISLSLGLTYKARSGEPINYLGSHPLYGEDEVFVLPRGSGGRLPWVHTVDSRLAFNYKFTKDYVLSLSGELFNMFNFAAVTSVDETFTYSDVQPYVSTDPNKSPQQAICIAGTDSDCASPLLGSDGLTTLTTADINPNFKNTKSYQAPLSVRFGVRMSF